MFGFASVRSQAGQVSKEIIRNSTPPVQPLPAVLPRSSWKCFRYQLVVRRAAGVDEALLDPKCPCTPTTPPLRKGSGKPAREVSGMHRYFNVLLPWSSCSTHNKLRFAQSCSNSLKSLSILSYLRVGYITKTHLSESAPSIPTAVARAIQSSTAIFLPPSAVCGWVGYGAARTGGEYSGLLARKPRQRLGAARSARP